MDGYEIPYDIVYLYRPWDYVSPQETHNTASEMH